MEQITEAIGNSTTLLIERIFWLCLGAFLVLAITTSLIRGSKESNTNPKLVISKELMNQPKQTLPKKKQ